MKIIYNSILPFKGFRAMLTLSILWVRNEYRGNRQLDEQFLIMKKFIPASSLKSGLPPWLSCPFCA